MKKLTALVLSLVIAFGLGGCKSKPDRTGDTPELGEISRYTQEQLEKTVSAVVRWEYTPGMSSRYPAMPFSFDISHQKIMAACDSGTLIDFDHFDDTVIYEGVLSIARGEETTFGAIYSAALEGGPEFALIQNGYQLGGVLTQLST